MPGFPEDIQRAYKEIMRGQDDPEVMVRTIDYSRVVYPCCPVCGYPFPLEYYSICSSCGFEACGQEDWPDGENWPSLRGHWVESGMHWWADKCNLKPPEGWAPTEQLDALFRLLGYAPGGGRGV